VLEIGCGMGTMAMNWCQHGARIIAVDLNPVAVAQTAQRFKLFGLDALVLQVDANRLCCNNDTFDYVYSWGVLHHSPNLERSIDELFRVLRPGGEFGVMLYHRDSILYRYLIRYIEGFLHAESRFLGPLQLASRYTDGAREEGNPHTWPITRQEGRDLFSPYCSDPKIQVLGTDLDSSLQWLLPWFGGRLPRLVKKTWARRWGWSLWITGKKR
ncbi:MAG: class I SAM-dependent methyltransferase, partial [bacterium]